MVMSVENPEAIAYGIEFMQAFHDAKQTVNGKPPESPRNDLEAPAQARLYSPQMRGIFVGTMSNSNIVADEALRFGTALQEAGFRFGFTGWDGMGAGEFNFVIGPP
jgi:hypothetical protein